MLPNNGNIIICDTVLLAVSHYDNFSLPLQSPMMKKLGNSMIFRHFSGKFRVIFYKTATAFLICERIFESLLSCLATCIL